MPRMRSTILATSLLLLASAPPAHAAITPSEAVRSGGSAPNSTIAFGSAPQLPSPSTSTLNAPLVDMTSSPSGNGNWLVASDGGVFSYGDARFFGSAGSIQLNQPIVSIASTPTGDGYWLAASDGGVFAYGDAGFYGSAGSIPLNEPVVDMIATPSGKGYWLVASDGGVFAYGDANFAGSTGSMKLNAPIVRADRTPDGEGYWLAAKDGGIFSFGDATFMGSAGEKGTSNPTSGFAAAPDGSGYWLVTSTGTVHAFGLGEFGSLDSTDEIGRPETVSMSARPGSDGYWLLQGSIATIADHDSGPGVLAAQKRLQTLGYWLGTPDGAYGELTRQAVYAFDKVEGLPVDGEIDGATAQRLDTAARPSPVSKDATVITEIDKAKQVLYVVRDGQALWTFNVSTGTEQPYVYKGRTELADTPTGRFAFAWAVDGDHRSDLGLLYRPRFFETTQGIAVHGYGEVPPYPASHGCVRVTSAAMDFIWDNDLMPLQSPVFVYGTTPS